MLTATNTLDIADLYPLRKCAHVCSEQTILTEVTFLQYAETEAVLESRYNRSPLLKIVCCISSSLQGSI